MFKRFVEKFQAWRCKNRGFHIWKRYLYGGLGGSYYVTKCACCGKERPNSFCPEMTL